MGSRPRRRVTSVPISMRRTRRRLQSRRNRVCKPLKSTRMISNTAAVGDGGGGGGGAGGGGCTASVISDKLEALKSLMPAHIDGEEIKADELFQETADYIVLLRTQILVLQKLISFYGCPPQDNQNAL